MLTSDPSPLALVGRLRDAVRRRVLVHRRLLAAVLVGLATLLAIHAVRPPPEPAVIVWTAARDLPSGTLLSDADLARTAYPPGAVPARAITDPRAVAGRYLAAPLRRGAPVTDLAVVAPALTSSDPDRSVVAVRIGDAGMVSLLRAGDLVDLVGVDPDRVKAPTTVATGARVVALPEETADVAAVGQGGRLVVFAVRATEAGSVVAAAATGYIALVVGG